MRPSQKPSRRKDYARLRRMPAQGHPARGAPKAAGAERNIRVSWPKAKLADYFTHPRSVRGVAAEHCGAAKFIALDDVCPLEFPTLPVLRQETEEDLKNLSPCEIWGIMRTNQGNFVSRPASPTGEEGEGMLPLQAGWLDRIEGQVDRHLPRPQLATSSEVRVARATTPADLRSRAPPVKSVSSSRSSERRISQGNSIAPVRRRNAMSGWSVLLYGAGDKTDGRGSAAAE